MYMYSIYLHVYYICIYKYIQTYIYIYINIYISEIKSFVSASHRPLVETDGITKLCPTFSAAPQRNRGIAHVGVSITT